MRLVDILITLFVFTACDAAKDVQKAAAEVDQALKESEKVQAAASKSKKITMSVILMTTEKGRTGISRCLEKKFDDQASADAFTLKASRAMAKHEGTRQSISEEPCDSAVAEFVKAGIPLHADYQKLEKSAKPAPTDSH